MPAMTLSISRSLRSRLLAAAIHLTLSLAVAAAAAGLVFGIWYPYPYREISGGSHLFLIVVAVDVIMGPLLTLVVFNRNKPPAELRRDLTVIGVLQVAALAYGLWTVAVARPVHLVFEIDRFRVVHAMEIPEEEMHLAPPEFRRLPWTGPTLLSVRDFSSPQEGSDATLAALQGLPLGARPFLWQRYDKATPQVLKIARPLSELKTRFPDRVSMIEDALRSGPDQGTSRSVVYAPMTGRGQFWTVLLDLRTTEVIAFVPIDSF
jgi:hypothetical protein